MAPMGDDLDDFEERFHKTYELLEKQLLGEGTYGQVYLAKNRSSGAQVAAKQMTLDAQDEGVPSTALREIAYLKELSENFQHPNVVTLLDVYLKPSKLVLVFEYVDSDLKKYMKNEQGLLKPARVKNLMYQLCRGVKFCHLNHIIHRDLKPANLLIHKTDVRLKIADFGLARTYHSSCPKYTHDVVTVWYRSPEILLGGEIYNIPVDIWSVGCIFAEIATGQPLFAGDSEIDTIFKIFNRLGTPNETTWPGIDTYKDFRKSYPKWRPAGWTKIKNLREQVGQSGLDLLDKFFVYLPHRRISARDAETHEYFKDVDTSNIGKIVEH